MDKLPYVQKSAKRWASGLPWNVAVASLILVLATVALYYPVSNHQFLSLDDTGYVTNNPYIWNGLGWQTLRWAFTTNAEANWHPVTWISHALDFQLFRLDPSGHHLMNLALHVANVLALFWVLLCATGYVGRSFMVAALFAIHPLNVESVAWVAERKNLLSMLFFLLALAAYQWYTRRPRVGRYLAVAMLYALGLMAKPQVITLPCVLLLWDYWPLERFAPRRSPFAFRQNSASGIAGEQRRANSEEPSSGEQRTAKSDQRFLWLFLEKLPLFALCAASAVITVHVQRSKGAVSSYPFSTLAANAVVSYWRYLAKAFWPSHLAIFYPYARNGEPRSQVLLSICLLLLITTLALQARRYRYVLVGWLWFVGTMVPMIGVVQVGAQAMADRYTYLPMVGLLIVLCWGAADWAQHNRLSPLVLRSVSPVLLLALALVTRRQLEYWSDDLSVWTHALQVTSGNYVAEDMVGAILLDRGETTAAVQHLRTAAAICPLEPLTYFYLGIYQEQQANPEAAVAEFWKVVRLTRTPELKAETLKRMAGDYRALGNEEFARKCSLAASQLRR